MRLRVVQVDAFAQAPFEGNPAAVMPLAAWLPDATLQSIAAENNLSETAFLLPDASGAADYELRWFTPAVEVALCGHATLASGHVMLNDHPARERMTFRTRRSGILAVARADSGYALDLPTWPTEAQALPEIVAALGVDALDTRWSPNRYALVRVADEAAVRACAPNMRALAAHGDVLAIVTAPGEQTDFVSRCFVPGGGIDEDPVTGSAHAVAAPYWAELFGRAELTAFQASTRGGHLRCRVAGDRVELTGGCVTVMEGWFLLRDSIASGG